VGTAVLLHLFGSPGEVIGLWVAAGCAALAAAFSLSRTAVRETAVAA
jgi:hypothetical protein